MNTLRAACVQMTSGPEIIPNLDAAEALIRDAAGQGARFIATPENSCMIRNPLSLKLESALPQEEHPGIERFSSLAAALNVWLLIGSLTIKLDNGKLANRSFLFSGQGVLVATYDKIHMFDVSLPDGEVHNESAVVQPGKRAVVAQTPWGGLGLSICYDLRFAALYRAMARAGAGILVVPAAFTVPTGRAHWEILLRARAIETGSFVIAPGQVGEHENGRRTWGHSLMISPWGEILADAGGDGPGVIVADLDMDKVARARASILALEHDRDYDLSV